MTIRSLRIIDLTWALPVALVATARAQTPQFTCVEVTGRPLQQWEVSDLGPQGQVIGRSWTLSTTPAQSRGFVWHNGSMTTLDGPAGETVTEASCMDAQGVVFGGYADRRFDLLFLKMHPVRWVAGSPVPYSNSQSINGSEIFACSPTTGVAVGWAKPCEPDAPGWNGEYGYFGEFPFGESDPECAFIWSGGAGAVLVRGLGLSGDGARGINDAGQAAINLNGYELGGAALYDPRFGLARLPHFGVGKPNAGWSTFAFAINQSGRIVGRAQVSGGVEHPVVWHRGEITDLGLPAGFIEGEARDINDAGAIVGALSNQNFEFGVAPSAAFLHSGSSMHNLNQCVPAGAPFTFSGAVAINNAGQILVESGFFGARRYAVLTPIR